MIAPTGVNVLRDPELRPEPAPVALRRDAEEAGAEALVDRGLQDQQRGHRRRPCARTAPASGPRRGRSSPCRARRTGRGRPPCWSTARSPPARASCRRSQRVRARRGRRAVVAAQKRRTSSGVSSTRNAQPWLKPALGARTALRERPVDDRRVDRARRRSCGPSGGGVRRPGTPWEPSMPDDFEQMWRDLAPVGRSASSAAATSASRSPTAERELRAWFVEQCAARGLDGRGRRRRQPGRLVARRPGASGPARADRLAPRLGARRRGVRRAARRGLALAAVDLLRDARRSCRPADRRRRSSSRRRARGSGWPASGRGWRPARSTPDAGARAARPRRRTPAPTRWPRPGSSPTLGRSRDCCDGVGMLRRAARRAGPRPRRPRRARSAWPAGSGRTAATASTSPARPTTPAPPGWRTGATRC